MKTLGLIGGISSFSTVLYYKTINQLVNDRLGGSHSARLILYSVDFEDLKKLQEKGDWLQISNNLSAIASILEQAGAHCLVICSNTPHLAADAIKLKMNIPLIHIAEKTAKEIASQKIKKVGLLGTRFTMENNFFINKLTEAGIETIIPENEDRDTIHQSIMTEFTKGRFLDTTKTAYLKIINKLEEKGAQGIILGCTEIALLLNQTDCDIKLFDTTTIHAKAAVDFALTSP